MQFFLEESNFQDWWHTAERSIPKAQVKGFNPIVILVIWWLWKHRNKCVFEGGTPSANAILQNIKNDAKLWCLARAAGLRKVWP